jgi:hypothetical protein
MVARQLSRQHCGFLLAPTQYPPPHTHTNTCAPQEAAGTLVYMREREANKVDAPVPVDCTSECTSLMEKLLLAQAQARGAGAGGQGGGPCRPAAVGVRASLRAGCYSPAPKQPQVRPLLCAAKSTS